MSFARPAAAVSEPLTRHALQGYQRVSIEANVATASPHQLIALLFQRLVRQLTEVETAAIQQDTVRRLKATERALAIVDGLDVTLDHERGGSVSQALHGVYGMVRDRLLAGNAEGLAEARAGVAEIADAWAQIRPTRSAAAA